MSAKVNLNEITTVRLTSGISLTIPPGVWPDGVDPTVTVSQLKIYPAGAPRGATVRVSSLSMQAQVAVYVQIRRKES